MSKLRLHSLALLLFFVVSACGGDSSVPTGPSGPTSQTGSTAPDSSGSPTANPPTRDAAVACSDKSSVRVVFETDSEKEFRGDVTVTNLSTTCHADIAVATFSMFAPVPDWNAQVLFDIKFVRVEPGQSMKVNVKIPLCASQTDVLFGVTQEAFLKDNDIADPPHPPSKLVAFRHDYQDKICLVPKCEHPLTISSTWVSSSNVIRVLPTASMNRPVTLTISIDGGAPITRTTNTGSAVEVGFTPDDKEHNVVVTGKFTDDNGETCEAKATVIIPKKPVEVTCTAVSSTLTLGAVGATSTTFTASVTPNWQTNRSATIQWGDGTSEAATSGVEKSHTYQRSAFPQGVTVTLTVDPTGLMCAATVKVPPPPLTPTCADVNATLQVVGQPIQTPTAVTYTLRSSWTGNYRGILFRDVVMYEVTSGQQVSVVLAPGSISLLQLVVDPAGLICKADQKLSVPNCNVINPTMFQVTSSSAIEQNGQVTVNFDYDAANMSGVRVGLRWRNGSSVTTKDSTAISVICAVGRKSFTFPTWTSGFGPHLPSQGGRYSIIRYTGSDGNPSVIEEIPIPFIIR